MSLYAQHPRPRCPHCKRILGYNLGWDLDVLRGTPKAVYLRCRLCHHEWRSTNDVALLWREVDNAIPA